MTFCPVCGQTPPGYGHDVCSCPLRKAGPEYARRLEVGHRVHANELAQWHAAMQSNAVDRLCVIWRNDDRRFRTWSR